MPKEFEPRFPISENEEKKIEEYYQYLKPLGETFCRYGAYGTRIAPQAETFSFDHQKKEVIVSLKFIEKLKLTKEEGKWLLCHELSHLIQLFQDPEEYLESIEIAKKKGEEKGEIFRKAYHNFFNAFSDIHGNSIIKALMPIYQKGGIEEKLPEKIYQEKLFKKEDYSSLPLSQQFLYFLLKKMMAKEAPCKISKEVKDVINSPIRYFGEKYDNLEEFVRTKIADPRLEYKDVLFIEKEFLLPIYEKLLAEDEKQGKLKEIPDFLGEFDLDEGLDKETLGKIKKQIEESKKPPQKRYEDYLKREFERAGREKGFSEREIERMAEIEKKTEKIVRDLEDLWENFIQRSIEYSRERKEGFKTGAGISPERLIAQLPVLLTKPSEAEIFYRYVGEEKKEEIKPKKIVLYLLPDLSGSMDSPKREAVQEVAYALNKSLINFYRTGKLAMSARAEEFPISIDYRMIAFGSTIQELTEPTPEEINLRNKIDTPQRDLDKELWQAIFKIQKIDLEGTNDALALKEVEKELKKDPRIENFLKENEEIWIVLEITDGETDTVQESKSIVKELNEKSNVYCRAIQIPGPIYSEAPKPEKPEEFKPPEILPPTGTFKEVWGEKWGKRLEDLNVLKETVVAILYDALRRQL